MLISNYCHIIEYTAIPKRNKIAVQKIALHVFYVLNYGVSIKKNYNYKSTLRHVV